MFTKQEKYSLGQKIENNMLEILELTLTAVYLQKDKKTETIIKASDKNNFVKYLIRLAYETKSLDDKKYLCLEEKLTEIGKMFGGWLRSIKE